MTKRINLSEPLFIGNEKKYLISCIDDNWVSSKGKFVKRFEKKISEYTNCKYTTTAINGTSALHLSLKVLGVKKNDEVIVPTLTFVASINSIIYNQARPFFMDVDSCFNLDIDKCLNFLKFNTKIKSDGFCYNKITSNRIFAIMPVHLFGNLVNLDKLSKICKNKNIKIIEDASESLGSKYLSGKFKDKHPGTIGDAGIISFNGNKVITSGGGGIFLTKNKKYFDDFKYLADQAKNQKVYSMHNDIGYNYQMSNLNAAIGLAQLEKIETLVKKRKTIYEIYRKQFSNSKMIKICETPKYSVSNNWLTIIKFINKNDLKKVINKLVKNNIESRPLWILNHKQKPFKKYITYNIQHAYDLHSTCLCLPSSPNLKTKDIIRISNLIKDIFN